MAVQEWETHIVGGQLDRGRSHFLRKLERFPVPAVLISSVGRDVAIRIGNPFSLPAAFEIWGIAFDRVDLIEDKSPIPGEGEIASHPALNGDYDALGRGFFA